MHGASFANAYNLDLIESYYQQWQRSPDSVDERWQAFFEGFELPASLDAALRGEDNTVSTE